MDSSEACGVKREANWPRRRILGSSTRSENGCASSISSSVSGFSRVENSARRVWSGSDSLGERRPTMTRMIATTRTTIPPIAQIGILYLRSDFNIDDFLHDQETGDDHDQGGRQHGD